MPTSRVLFRQKPPRKPQGRRQRLDFRENPNSGVPWANWYDYAQAADPTIGTIAPSTLAVTANATLLTFTGTNYGPGSVIEADQVGLPTTYVNATTLTTSWDPTVVKTVQFTVRNTSGKESADKPFVVTASLRSGEAPPTASSTKAQIVAWLVGEGVVVDEEAASHFTKAELLEIVQAYLNDDQDALDGFLDPADEG